MVAVRPARGAPAGTPPRCFTVRSVRVWGTSDDDELWRDRLAFAADTWRAAAHADGVSNAEVWRAVPGNVSRFTREPAPERLAALLDAVGAIVEELAAEARQRFPNVFDPGFTPGQRGVTSGWHLPDLRERQAALGRL